MATKHKSRVLFPTLGYKGHGRNAQPEEMPVQARFLIRLATACWQSGCKYDVNWSFTEGRMWATITAEGNIPEAKPLPKAPKEKPVATWKPNPYDAEYRLNVGKDLKGKELSGFILTHSSGLALVRFGSSESGSVESNDGDGRRISEGWNLVHTASLLPIGTGPLSLQKATAALLYAASLPVDWKLPDGAIQKHPNARRAMWEVLAQHVASKHTRQQMEARLKSCDPYVSVEKPKPELKPIMLPVQDRWGRTTYVRYDPSAECVA